MIDSGPGLPARWVATVWSLLVLLGAFASYANASDAGRPMSVGRALYLGLAAWGIWAFLTPLIVWLGQRWPVDRRRHWRLALAHIAAAGAVGLLAAGVTAAAVFDPAAGSTPVEHIIRRMAGRGPMGATLYFVILGVSYLTINTRQLRQGELLAERLSRDLAEAQLGALRMQLQPHFLFNSLNAVTTLVRDREVERADRALMVLSDMLRTTLRQGVEPCVPLREELAFVRRYLEIERLRFGDRLQVRWALEDAVGSTPVPTFILQPLVENALRHGIGPKVGGGRVEVRAHHNGEWLQLVVQDDGYGVPPDRLDAFNTGVGLTNTRSRLEHLYPANHTFEFQTPEGGGLAVTIVIPFTADAEMVEESRSVA